LGSITIVGLGPGAFGLITLESWEKIKSTAMLILRTAEHPTVEKLREHGIKFISYDNTYEDKLTFEEVYSSIACDVIKQAKAGGDIVYAVPGSPLVAERTVVIIRDLARKENISLTILPGMSFVEVLYVRLGIDPIDGLTIIDAVDFDNLPMDMPTGIVITQVYNEQVASDTKLSLMESYPDDYEVTFVRNLGLPDEEIRQVPLYKIDRQPHIDHLTSLYVSPRKKETRFMLEPLIETMHTLRSPGGCPWDVIQTHKSLRRNLIEEVYEVIEAIDLEDSDLLCEELGDLLLQIVFHARMAEETGGFSMQNVIDGITEKLIRRHPHVFGDVSVLDAGEVMLNWDAIKKQEKLERTSVLDGVPKDLPSLMQAYKLQHKAAQVGFDWDTVGPVWEKLAEEIDELWEASEQQDSEHIEEELGDVLFSVVNLSRFMKVDAEVALHRANNKFKKRFFYVEEQVKKQKKDWSAFTLKELDSFWNAAKRQM
jgi:tetrapyrrole methylase family protein / MazG family protein